MDRYANVRVGTEHGAGRVLQEAIDEEKAVQPDVFAGLSESWKIWQGLGKMTPKAPDRFLVVGGMLDGKRASRNVRREETRGLIVLYGHSCAPNSSVSLAPLRGQSRPPTEAMGGVDLSTPRPPRSRDGHPLSPGREGRPGRIGNSQAHVMGDAERVR